MVMELVECALHFQGPRLSRRAVQDGPAFLDRFRPSPSLSVSNDGELVGAVVWVPSDTRSVEETHAAETSRVEDFT